nr:TcmI family type II polyketide cyclase [Micromonospora sp. DSM 115978]
MSRLVIVGRVIPGTEGQVAQIFGESDRTELPQIAGVRHRSLYVLDDLYVHLLETDEGSAGVERASGHPLFLKISQELSAYISPYSPNWRSPRDAMARCFYHWDAAVPVPGSRG